MEAMSGAFVRRRILIALAALMPFALLEFHYVSSMKDKVVVAARERASTLARAAALQHRTMLEAAVLSLDQVAQMASISDGSPRECVARIQQIRANSALFVNLARGTPDGDVDCTGMPGQTRFIAGAIDVAKRAMATGQPAVGPATISPNHGRPILPLARPLPSLDGRVERVIVAGINLYWLDRAVDELALNSGDRVMVLNDQGTVLASRPSMPDLIGKTITHPTTRTDATQFAATLQDGTERHFELTSFEGGTRIAVGIDQGQVLAELDAARTAHLIGFALTAAGSVTLLVLMDYFGLARRGRRFAKVAAQIAGGDRTARLHIDHRDPLEFARIAASFNSMADGIAERDRQIEQAHDEVRKLSRAVEQSAHMVIITDINGTIEYVNPKFIEVTGYQPEEAIGRTPAILRSGDTPPSLYKTIWETILCGREWHGDLKDRRKDGSVFWAAVSIAPVRAPNGSLTHFVSLHEDITRRKLDEESSKIAREQAEVANRAKSEILANMSHELRTPLNAIIGFSETMLIEMFGPLGSAKYLEYAKDIHYSGQHLLELINDILDVSAIEAGKMELHEEAVAVDHLVAASVRLVADRAEKGKVTLQSRLAPDLPSLFGDARRLKQILLNILSNAVKFTPEDGSVTITAEINGYGDLAVKVKDTGIGMSPEEIAKAVTKFGQVDSSLARKHDGTGLGLPLTIGLVDLHGGTLDISSKKGQGTEISIVFPKSRLTPSGRTNAHADERQLAPTS
ncbi:hypothetical protein CU669_18500 [Paramagnetospirillum kuznetsovii]|uniref:histidine kinase n=1 Tax=Paramagnetospirillum kuznetsovii TaxID=2053833 RepID=A0A364NTR2_9PROT|nr:ATP-binding protein [Paramagnetospirillum kuznetsovii]RAU20442.1 hypothetical protein CU669_18500 [Paramagnetospirillum kuznetsovii]